MHLIVHSKRHIFLPFWLTFLFFSIAEGQVYRSPVNHEVLLSGTFGELRTDHFHMGIDIKSSNGHAGDSIFSISGGYIETAEIKGSGYGNRVTVRHEDGKRSVYAHLLNFNDELSEHLYNQVYDEQTYEVKLDFHPHQIPLNAGEYLGRMGNTGHSFGPHLHIEIRDSSNKMALNPLHHLPSFRDDRSPEIMQVVISEYNSFHEIVNKTNYGLKRTGKNTYETSEEPFVLSNDYFSVSIETIDRHEKTSNKNGIYELKFFNGDSLLHHFRMDSIMQHRPRYMNTHINYMEYLKTRKKLHKCFSDIPNPICHYSRQCPLIKTSQLRNDSFRLWVSDFRGNSSDFSFSITMDTSVMEQPRAIANYALKSGVKQIVEALPFQILFEAETLPSNTRVYTSTTNPDKIANATLHIRPPDQVLLTPARISMIMDTVPPKMRGKTYLGLRTANEAFKPLQFANKAGARIEAFSYNFGDIRALVDTARPTIKVVKGPSNNLQGTQVVFTDDVWSFEDLEYSIKWGENFVYGLPDAKNNRIVLDGLPIQDDEKRALVMEVTDPCGNSNIHQEIVIVNQNNNATMTTLQVGDKAPNFESVDQNGNTVKLSDFADKKLVLYFYPKDDTPGCTSQACNLRDNYKQLMDSGYSILGVSADGEAKHQKFINKYDLPFPLLSDTEKEVINAYGVWGPKKFMGRTFDGIHRTTFIIEKGQITEIIKKVKTKDHTAQIIQE